MNDLEEAQAAFRRLVSRGDMSFKEMAEALGMPKNICLWCLQPIKVTIFLGEDWCSDNCRKALGKDIE